MIQGIHGLFYSTDARATRDFIRDKLRLPFSDVGDGWLIFDLAEGDVGVHPVDESGEPAPGTHDVSFYCDDIRATITELRGRGVHFDGEPVDHSYGYVTYFAMPGGVSAQLFQPRYQKTAASNGGETVANLDSEYQAAVGRNDATTMGRILADDFVLISSTGRTYSKADLMEEARNGRFVYERQDDTDRTVRVWGDTAVVTALLWAKGVEDGKPFAYRVWFSDTYARTRSGWKYVLGHASGRLPWPP